MRYKLLILGILIVFVLFNHTVLLSQPDTTIRIRFGGLLGGSILLHTTNFQSLPGFPTCCPEFHSGSGFAPVAGVFVELPMSENISHSFRTSLGTLNGTITASEIQPIIVSSVLRNARISHQIDVKIKGIGFEPLINFRVSNQLGLFLGFRFDMGLSGTASTKEELIEPETGTFENNSRIRNIQSGNIIGLQPVVVSALGGMRFSVPLNTDNSLLMLPELSFAFGLSHVTGGDDWRVHAVRLGLGFAFQAPKVNRPSLSSTITPTLTASITAVPYDGVREFPTLPLTIEEFSNIDIQPILPMLFFEYNSDAIPIRYRTLTRQEIIAYDSSQFIGSTALESYYSILNIVGYRLRTYVNEKITLVAVSFANSNDREMPSLPQQRAENVSRYLQQIWGIDKKRISIIEKNAPDSFSNRVLNKDEKAELRRVEIDASNLILGSLLRKETTRKATPQFLRFRPSAGGNESVSRWELSVRQKSNAIKLLSGNNGMPLRLQVDLAEENLRLSDESITANLIVYGKSGIASSDNITVSSRLISLSDKFLSNNKDTISIITYILNPNATLIEYKYNPQFEILSRTINDYGEITTSEYDGQSDIFDKLNNIYRDSFSILRSEFKAPYSNFSPESRMYNKCSIVRIRTWPK